MGIKGYPSDFKEDRTEAAFATVEPVNAHQNALSVLAKLFHRNLGGQTAEANCTTTVINCTGHNVERGDVIRFTSGNLARQEVRVWEVDTNSITLAEELSEAPANLDTFDVLRPTTPNCDQDGNLVIGQGPTKFVLDTVDTEVEEDTGTPANSRPFPVKVLDGAGAEVDFATQTTLAAAAADLALIEGKDFATQTTLSALNGKFSALGQNTQANSQPVTTAGRTRANAPVYHDYSSVNVTAAAYTQIVASTSSAAHMIEIFDSSGQGMILATGAALSEVDQLYIFPGGNGMIPFYIPSGTRVAVKALTGTANAGFLAVNFYT